MTEATATLRTSAPEVVRMVGHDLRNRLGVLSNSVYYLSLRLGDSDEKMVRHLSLISQEVVASSRIVANLMDWVGPKEPLAEELLLNPLVESLCTQSLLGPGVEMVTQLENDLPPVYADAAQLSRALENLLAYEGSLLEDGQVAVSTRSDGSLVAFCLHDTASPFAPGTAASLLDLPSRERFSPAQLGLLVAYELLTANKCRLAVAESGELPWRFRVLIPTLAGARAGAWTPPHDISTQERL